MKYEVEIGGTVRTVEIRRDGPATVAVVDGRPVVVDGRPTNANWSLLLADDPGTSGAPGRSPDRDARRTRSHDVAVVEGRHGTMTVYVDGADEINPNKQLIKGGGAALTREKIIAGASRKFICIADESKLVAVLGKAEASHDGKIRGYRHTMLDDSDISSTRHARGFVCGALAGLVGHAEIYVSGGAEHQGPDGGGPVALIAEQNR